MQIVLLTVQLLVSIAMIGVVLLQKSEGGALGMGGGGSGLGGLFSPRGAADTLTRTTAILGLCFFLSSLGLTFLALRGHPESTALPGALPSNSLNFQLPKPAQHPLGPQVPQVPKPH
jgi:preprotein translocase subunit SecG